MCRAYTAILNIQGSTPPAERKSGDFKYIAYNTGGH